jgi:hypothetical protein
LVNYKINKTDRQLKRSPIPINRSIKEQLANHLNTLISCSLVIYHNQTYEMPIFLQSFDLFNVQSFGNVLNTQTIIIKSVQDESVLETRPRHQFSYNQLRQIANDRFGQECVIFSCDCDGDRYLIDDEAKFNEYLICIDGSLEFLLRPIL